MEEINTQEQVVVSNEANQNEINPQNTEGETKNLLKKRKPKPKTPKRCSSTTTNKKVRVGLLT